MENNRLIELIERYLNGNCTEEEKKWVDDWYNSFEETEGYLEHLSPAEKDVLKGQLYNKINQRLPNKNKAKSMPKEGKNHHRHFPWQKIAAGFVILTGLTVAFMLLNSSWNRATITTGYGETRNIILPDSSTVVLNANSKLIYTDGDWKNGVREVDLKGEAFFNVREKPSEQKFLVHTEDLEVEVLGTEFNVNSRKFGTRVILNSGKVKLGANKIGCKKEILMEPGELIEIKHEQKEITQKVVDTKKYTSWRNNQLIFDATPLFEIARILRNNYGYKVEFQDPALKDKQFNGAAPADDIDNLLEKLSRIYAVEISKNNNYIIFKD